ncbi:MAG: hypothetical protein IEMM0002_0118 [bacterium]|nr:MAG: hypothetical protein IEMM0002_0118 [bacterium]
MTYGDGFIRSAKSGFHDFLKCVPTVYLFVFFSIAANAAEKQPSANNWLREGRPLPLILTEKKVQKAFDPGAPPKTRIKITENLRFGARLDIEGTLEKNYDLDAENPDDLAVLDPVLSLALLYKPHKNIEAFTNIEPYRRFVYDEEQKKKSKNRINILQAYIAFKGIGDGLTLKVGRQRFKDKREWLYDEELDGIRLFYTLPQAVFDFSISEKKHKDIVNPGKDGNATNYVFSATYAPNKDREFSAYTFIRNDRSGKDDNPVFFGGHLSVEEPNTLEYWLEFANVQGKEGPKSLNGSGVDVGFSFGGSRRRTKINLPYKPYISLSYAFGTGDQNPDDDVDTNFRQTGYQDNDAKYKGVARVKYYGEMFDPELSNMGIFTAALGLKPRRKTSIDLVYHYYHQQVPYYKIRDAKVDEDPDGKNMFLGQEVDFVAGYKGKKNLKLSLVLAYFFPGAAFTKDNDVAMFAELKIRYEF